MSVTRLKNYTILANTPSGAGCALATGVVAAIVPGQATADLQIWNVGQVLPQITADDSPALDLRLMATINTTFQINFFGTGSDEDQVFWSPYNNLSFINFASTASSTSGNDPAIWMNTVLIGPDALNGASSNYGYNVHFWTLATNSHTTSNDIQSNINPGETGAFGIRFNVNNEGDYLYGWVEVSMEASGYVTIERWALETTANIAAEYSPAASTSVPGIGGLAALAMGAAGVRSRRKRTVA